MSENTINDQSEVLLHFDMKLEDGSAVDSTRVNNKPAKMIFGDGSLTPAFQDCLLGLAVGEKKTFKINGEEVFGAANPNNIVYMDRSRFDASADLKVGMIMGFAQPDGSEMPGIVRAIEGNSVTVDFNHPLSGHELTFDVEILSVS